MHQALLSLQRVSRDIHHGSKFALEYQYTCVLHTSTYELANVRGAGSSQKVVLCHAAPWPQACTRCSDGSLRDMPVFLEIELNNFLGATVFHANSCFVRTNRAGLFDVLLQTDTCTGVDCSSVFTDAAWPPRCTSTPVSAKVHSLNVRRSPIPFMMPRMKRSRYDPLLA